MELEFATLALPRLLGGFVVLSLMLVCFVTELAVVPPTLASSFTRRF